MKTKKMNGREVRNIQEEKYTRRKMEALLEGHIVFVFNAL
jgi:hypothetical protein